jgi:hypothetical protein
MIKQIVESFENRFCLSDIYSFEVNLRNLKIEVVTNKSELEHYKRRFENTFSRFSSALSFPDLAIRLYQFESSHVRDLLCLPSSGEIPPEFVSVYKAGLLDPRRSIYFDLKTQDRCLQMQSDEYFFYSPRGDILYLGHKTRSKMILTIVREMLIHATPGLQVLHGAAVDVENNGLVLAGSSKSGKTTLMLALLKRGATFLSNDNVFVLNGRILPFLDDIDISPSTVEIFPELEMLVPKNFGTIGGKYGISPMSLTSTFGAKVSDSPTQVKAIFNLDFSSHLTRPRLTPILDSPLRIPSIATPFACLTFWAVPFLHADCNYDKYFSDFYRTFLQFWTPILRSGICFNLLHGPDTQLTWGLISQATGIKLV